MTNEQSPQSPKGVIYDAGYREYTGEYGGRIAAVASLIWDDVKRALGIKRTWVYKLFLYLIILGQFGIFLFMFFSDYLIGETLQQFENPDQLRAFLGVEAVRYYVFFSMSTTLIWFLSALGAPWLMCQERKNRVLPLYFARPIKPLDYLLAKGLAIFGLLAVFSAGPVVLLFLAKSAIAPDALAYFSENSMALLAILASAAMISAFYASFSMGIASLVENPGFAAGGIIGIPFISGTLFFILLLVSTDPLVQLIDFSSSVSQVVNWIFLGTIPPLDFSSIQSDSPEFAARLEQVAAPLDVWIYALEALVISLLGWLIAFWVYRREANR